MGKKDSNAESQTRQHHRLATGELQKFDEGGIVQREGLQKKSEDRGFESYGRGMRRASKNK